MLFCFVLLLLHQFTFGFLFGGGGPPPSLLEKRSPCPPDSRFWPAWGLGGRFGPKLTPNWEGSGWWFGPDEPPIFGRLGLVELGIIGAGAENLNPADWFCLKPGDRLKPPDWLKPVCGFEFLNPPELLWFCGDENWPDPEDWGFIGRNCFCW